MSGKRPPVDRWLLEEMLAANDGRCGCCGKEITLATCQRGHRIKRKPDGSNDGPENFFPVCAQCNKGNTLSEITPASALRSDFFERIALRILARIPAQYHCNMVANHRRVVLTSQPTENSYVIDFKNSEFDAATEVYFWSVQRARKLTVDQAEKLLDDFITAAEKEGAPAPIDKTRLTAAVVDRGEGALARVRNRVLRESSWILDAKSDGSGGRTDSYFWQRVLANFSRLDLLERDYEKQRARDAEAAREDRERAERDRVALAAKQPIESEEEKKERLQREADARARAHVKEIQAHLFTLLEKSIEQSPEYAELYHVERDNAFYAIRRNDHDADKVLSTFVDGQRNWAAMTKQKRNEVKRQLLEDRAAALAKMIESDEF